MCHVTYMNEVVYVTYTNRIASSLLAMGCVTHMNESCHTCECVKSHVYFAAGLRM